DEGGGIFLVEGDTLNAVASTISNNHTPLEGGGIFAEDFVFVNLTNSSVTGNTADFFGGGIFGAGEAFVTMTGTTVSRNTAGFEGGGIFRVEGSTLNATASTIASNVVGSVEEAGDGGGIFADFSPVTLTSSRVSWNTAVGYGGGIAFEDGDINFNTAPPTGGAPTVHAGRFKQHALRLPSVPQ